MGSSTLGQKIRELRIRKGLTQGDLSAGLVTPSMVSQIESDKANPSHQLLCAIAERLETPVEYFLTDVQTQMEHVSAYQLACAYMANLQYEQAIELLQQLKKSHSTHVSMIDVSFQLAQCYLQLGSFGKARESLEYVYETAMTKKDSLLLAQVLQQMALLSLQKKEFPIAAHYLQKAYSFLQDAGPVDPFFYAEVVFTLGEVYQRMGKKEQSLRCYTEVYERLKPLQNLREIARHYLDLATRCRKSGLYERAAVYAQRSSSLFYSLENVCASLDMVACTGVVLGKEGQGDEWPLFVEQVKARYREYGFVAKIGKWLERLAQALLQVERYEEAKEQVKAALSYYDELGEDGPKIALYRLLGTICIRQDNLKEAEQWIQRAEDEVKRAGQIADQVRFFALQSQLMKKRKQFREAIFSLEQMNRLVENDMRNKKILI